MTQQVQGGDWDHFIWIKERPPPEHNELKALKEVNETVTKVPCIISFFKEDSVQDETFKRTIITLLDTLTYSLSFDFDVEVMATSNQSKFDAKSSSLLLNKEFKDWDHFIWIRKAYFNVKQLENVWHWNDLS